MEISTKRGEKGAMNRKDILYKIPTDQIKCQMFLLMIRKATHKSSNKAY